MYCYNCITFTSDTTSWAIRCFFQYSSSCLAAKSPLLKYLLLGAFMKQIIILYLNLYYTYKLLLPSIMKYILKHWQGTLKKNLVFTILELCRKL